LHLQAAGREAHQHHRLARRGCRAQPDRREPRPLPGQGGLKARRGGAPVGARFSQKEFMSTATIATQVDLRELASEVVNRAMKGGATAAEAVVREGSEFSTLVRLGQVETLKEAGSRAIGVRVFFGQRAASTSSG